jgi:hypothetical protein
MTLTGPVMTLTGPVMTLTGRRSHPFVTMLMLTSVTVTTHYVGPPGSAITRGTVPGTMAGDPNRDG